uniref:Uncharacterized protein n=1 Tax=Sphaerodactylus townsendi TaxID=933632 RepID=A0ACB8E6Z2_9SAUR
METPAGGYGCDCIGHSPGHRDLWLGPAGPTWRWETGQECNLGASDRWGLQFERGRDGEAARWWPAAPACTGNGGAAAGGVPAPATPVPPAPIPRRRRELKATFDGDPENLPYFLVQVGAYMRVMDDEYANDAERVYDIGALLEGQAVAWLVGLFEEDAPELRDLHHFMVSLCCRFEDV